MKKNLLLMLTTMVVLCAWSLVSCGGDDPIENNNTENQIGNNNNNGNNNNGNNNNGNNKIDAPNELFGAWQSSGSIYLFKDNGTGKVYNGWNYVNKTAESITDFTYSCNSQNSTLSFMGTNYTIEFRNANTKMNWLINNRVVVEFYIYTGELPEIGGNESGGNEGGDNNPDQVPSSPTGLNAQVNGTSIYVTWQSVNDATSYNVYRSSNATNSYTKIGTSNSTSYIDNNPLSGYNYYKVSAVNRNGESPQSNYVNCEYSENSGPTTLSAPTNVRVANEGNNYIPSVIVRWDAVSGAQTYKVYKSSSANGSYSLMDEVDAYYPSCIDQNPPTSGSRYYKVKAVNGSVESPFSSYAVYTPVNQDDAFEPSFSWGNCTVSGTKMTLRWTYNTGEHIGKPTKVTLRIYNPYAEEWQNTELSTTATSTTFDFSLRTDNDGWVKAGIIAENAAGSCVHLKMYNYKTKEWYGY